MKSLLVADDEPSVLAMTTMILQKAGYSCLKAPDGQAALELFEENPGVDALISDIRMPGLTGFELGRTLRMRNPSLPILLISGFAGHTLEDSQGLFVQSNIQFLPKPFTASQLVASVEMLFAMHAA